MLSNSPAVMALQYRASALAWQRDAQRAVKARDIKAYRTAMDLAIACVKRADAIDVTL